MVVGPDGRSYALELRPEAREDRARVAQALERLRVHVAGVDRVLDVGFHAASIYVVTALPSGPTVDERLRQEGPLPAREAAELVASLARALGRLHAAGFVHGAVGPDTVRSDGTRPLLTGLGRRLDATPADDVAGVGVVLYALLTGWVPSDTELGRAPSQALLSGSRRSDLADVARLDAICLRCLESDPGARYASMADLVEDLERAFDPSGPGAHGRSGSLGALAAGSIPLLVLLAGAAIVLRDDEHPSAPPQPAAPAPATTTSGESESEAVRSEPGPTPAASSSSPPSPPVRPRSVSGVADLSPLGPVASTVWRARGEGFVLGRSNGGWVTLRSTWAPKRMHLFTIQREGARLRASATVRTGEAKAQVGLVYGAPRRKRLFTVGLDSRGRHVVRHLGAQGWKTRLSTQASVGRPSRLEVAEVGPTLAVSIDGRERIRLGSGRIEGARIGFFVQGRGEVGLRDLTVRWSD